MREYGALSARMSVDPPKDFVVGMELHGLTDEYLNEPSRVISHSHRESWIVINMYMTWCLRGWCFGS